MMPLVVARTMRDPNKRDDKGDKNASAAMASRARIALASFPRDVPLPQLPSPLRTAGVEISCLMQRQPVKKSGFLIIKAGYRDEI